MITQPEVTPNFLALKGASPVHSHPNKREPKFIHDETPKSFPNTYMCADRKHGQTDVIFRLLISSCSY